LLLYWANYHTAKLFKLLKFRRWGIADIVMPQQVMGVAKDPANVPPIPTFKTSAVHDLNNIPVYTGSENLRYVRENRYWYPKLTLLPVPQSERDINPSLTQNEGW